MPGSVVFYPNSSGSVPTPPANGFSLFADTNNNGSPTIKLSNGTLQALGILPPVGCGGCGGGGGGCTCAEVAVCIDTDGTVGNSLINFINTNISLGGLSDVDLTGLNVNDVIQRDGANWVPVPLAGGTGPQQETPAGVVDSVNLIFTLATAPTNGVIQLHVQGVYQHPTIDYTLAGTTITFAASNAPTTGSAITAFYTA